MLQKTSNITPKILTQCIMGKYVVAAVLDNYCYFLSCFVGSSDGSKLCILMLLLLFNFSMVDGFISTKTKIHVLRLIIIRLPMEILILTLDENLIILISLARKLGDTVNYE